MVRTAAHNEALRDATRETIETAAVRVFARRGFAASSIRHIAEEAHLSTGSIYRHYASKEALFDELLDQATTGQREAAHALASDADPHQLVREFTRSFLSDLRRGSGEAEFFLVMNQGFLTDTPAGTRERLHTTQRPLWHAFSALVRRGQEAGDFAGGDPDQLTTLYFATLSGVAGMHSTMPAATDDTAVDIVLRLLIRKERA
ncbi:TetR/AcrR family transcriptional regulator [Microbacterium esteraromaticum]|uniref:TetR/AcrR family transcriptional regulator n=1 Tax=Microbacterium esteraromaticum TaxID=57043 RepID=A0A939IVB5_9MICO|nr:TetR/AcrR family transcriptional regulator [Microbacterium esteraromaticum]MBN8415647.1 TetR/AcrR family transcriptional regulator [Microbacterium esteraromaticum]